MADNNLSDKEKEPSLDNWGSALAEQTGEAVKDAAAGEADAWGSALNEQKAQSGTSEQAAGQGAPQNQALGLGANSGAKQAQLENFSNDPVKKSVSENPDLALVLDIPISITMEVGSTTITIRNLLQLNQGSVIELDRFAGEPLDVKVNGTLIAHGEVVVVNEKFGIRLTDVISLQERIQKLK
jgi:flagellar motor switch protein FliN/FliY